MEGVLKNLRYASDHADPVGAFERVVLPVPLIPSTPTPAVDGRRPRSRANGLHLGIMHDPSLTTSASRRDMAMHDQQTNSSSHGECVSESDGMDIGTCDV